MKTKLFLIIAFSAMCGLSANAQAEAGIDQEICTNSTTLNGWVDTGCSSPLWTVLSGSATINCPTCTTTTVTVGCGVTVLKLTPQYIGYSCNFTPDDMTITRYCTPTTANAGNDQNGCNNSSFTLSGNTPTVGTGTWSIVNGTATITNSSLLNSTVTGIAIGNSATLRWTISNGAAACPANVNTDDVVLANNAMPNVTASSNNESCYGCCNGNATANTSGGTTPYNYYWSNGMTTSTITGLCAGTYSVTLTDAKNCQDSASVTLTPTGISEKKIDSYFVISPNPTNGKFTVSMADSFLKNNNQQSSVTIYNLLGEKIYQAKILTAKSEIDLSSHRAGIYFVEVKIKDETQFKKLIIE